MTTPRAVFEQLLRGIGEGRWTELAELYAEDTVVEIPRGAATIRLEGREAIRAHLDRAPDLDLTVHDLVVHETTDPEVIVAEYRYRIGDSDAANVGVLRIRDGLIQASRDYHDHRALAAASGGLDELVSAVEEANARLEDGPLPEPGVPSAPANTPEGTFERLVHGLSAGLREEQAELYAEPTLVTHPFRASTPPLRTRAELRAHFGRAKVDLRARNLVLYKGIDPELVIGEFQYTGEASTGNRFLASNIFVMRVRGGLIAESRDYGDGLALSAAAGRLPDLIAAARLTE